MAIIYSAIHALDNVCLGMRMLLEDKANNATRYIDSLLSDPTINPYRYKSPENTRILSGEEEGIFAWIAVNYLSNVFTTNGIT